MRIRHVLLATTFVAVGLAAVFAASSGRPTPTTAVGLGEPTLAEVRHATARFRNVKVAQAEGYIRDSFDVGETTEMMGRPRELGSMGIHFFRPDLLGIHAPPSPRVNGTGTYTDFGRPSVLQELGELAVQEH